MWLEIVGRLIFVPEALAGDAGKASVTFWLLLMEGILRHSYCPIVLVGLTYLLIECILPYHQALPAH